MKKNPEKEIFEPKIAGNIIAAAIYNTNNLSNNDSMYVKAVDSLEKSEEIKNALLEYYYNRTPTTQAVAAKLYFKLDNTIEKIKERLKNNERFFVEKTLMDAVNRQSNLSVFQAEQFGNNDLRERFCNSIKEYYRLSSEGSRKIL
jgi:hypothetical protein